MTTPYHPVGRNAPLAGRVRALYEDSLVPVREIARLAGVTERSLYARVARHGWKRRRVLLAPEDACGAGTERTDVSRAERVTAQDSGSAREACAQLAEASEEARAAAASSVMARQEQARTRHEMNAELRALKYMSQTIRDLAAIERIHAARDAAQRETAEAASAPELDLEARRRALVEKIEALIAREGG